MVSLKWMFIFASGVITLIGCSTLPDYATPKVLLGHVDDVDLSDVISYRKLERADFKGEHPPAKFDERMAAVTCAYVLPELDKLAIDTQPALTSDGEPGYRVTFNNLRYRAVMDRNCSWWNSEVTLLGKDYVLEHEQIHFALFEIAARRWSDAPPLQLKVKADSEEAMALSMKTQYERQFQTRRDSLLAENHKFDEETSIGYFPEQQKRWLNLIRSALSSSTKFETIENYTLTWSLAKWGKPR
jgi:hypothetical protein